MIEFTAEYRAGLPNTDSRFSSLNLELNIVLEGDVEPWIRQIESTVEYRVG